MSDGVGEPGLVARKISKTITYYYHYYDRTVPPGGVGHTLCPSKNIPVPSPLTPSLHDSSSPPLLSDPDPSPPPSADLPSDPPESSTRPRPLVLLLPWLGARPSSAAKYRDLYLERGMDVLMVQSRVMDFLWPRWGLAYGLEVLKVMEEPGFSGRPLVVHACSIGGYTFSQTLTHIAHGPERYRHVAQRVVGHIYDSMVAGSLEHMATGLGKTLLPCLEGLVKNTAMLYFRILRRYTADYYAGSLHVFRNNPVTAPALFFYCNNDPLCDPAALEAVMELWRSRGVPVDCGRWATSVHAAHLRCHPEEYLSVLGRFLNVLPV